MIRTSQVADLFNTFVAINHPDIGKFTTDVHFVGFTSNLVMFEGTVRLEPGQGNLPVMDREFDRYREAGDDDKLEIDGIELLIGDGDDGMAVVEMNSHEVRIWIRHFIG